jgi:hypothetical protein
MGREPDAGALVTCKRGTNRKERRGPEAYLRQRYLVYREEEAED